MLHDVNACSAKTSALLVQGHSMGRAGRHISEIRFEEMPTERSPLQALYAHPRCTLHDEMPFGQWDILVVEDVVTATSTNHRSCA